jgi:aryl-alcohol dehydrogenase-like predicted oxidoreductase
MEQRQLGRQGLSVSAQGLGCMGMSFGYGPSDEAESIRTLHRAIDLGITFFDTAEVYGPYLNEELLGRALAAHKGRVMIATKFGFDILPTGTPRERMGPPNSRPKKIRASVEGSLRRLGVEAIDLLYQHRVDPLVPIEEVVGTMGRLVEEGKVRFLGLSEAGSDVIRRAHVVHPINVVQCEYSLFSRDVEAEILPACETLGIGFVAHSPLGRGLLVGSQATVTKADDDFRRQIPRFQGEAADANRLLVAALEKIAVERSVSPAQLAIAWVMAQGQSIVAIPGARKVKHLEQNAGAALLTLSRADLNAISSAIPLGQVQGIRYDARNMTLVAPSLSS